MVLGAKSEKSSRARTSSTSSATGGGAKSKVSVIERATVSGSSKMFSIVNEDHTLGNSLRHVLMEDKSNVELAGYAVPHPMEPIMTMRVQTKNGMEAELALKNGLESLKEICGHVDGAFEAAIADFKKMSD